MTDNKPLQSLYVQCQRLFFYFSLMKTDKSKFLLKGIRFMLASRSSFNFNRLACGCRFERKEPYISDPGGIHDCYQ